MTTTADEYRNEARKNIKELIDNLTRIVIDECAGYDDYKEEYRQDLLKILFEAIQIRERL